MEQGVAELSDFAGRPLTVLEKVYESEYTTAFGNRASRT